MNEFNIQPATESEYFSIVNEPGLLERIKEGNEGKPPVYNADSTYILRYKKYRLIFTLKDLGAGIYETHIACPKDSIRASRILVLAGIRWIAHEKAPIALLTSCPEGKIANMCRKIGFIEVKKIKDKVYFILSLAGQFN